MKTVRMPIKSFAQNNSGVDLTDIRKMRDSGQSFYQSLKYCNLSRSTPL